MELGLLIIPAGLTYAHMLGTEGKRYFRGSMDFIRSFAAGFSIGYVFLFLIPELSSSRETDLIDSTSLALIGFTLFHASHKFIFKSKTTLRDSFLDDIHILTAGSYSFLITFSLVEIARQNYLRGLIISLIIALHTVLSDVTQTKTNKEHKNKLKLPILIFSTLLAGFLSVFTLTSPTFTSALFALTTGAIVYIAIREELPSGSSGRPEYFILGVLSILIVHTVVF